MAMDMVRACYRTQMRLFNDNNLYPVRWYYCDPGARAFPYYHRFGSGNYSDPQLRTGLVGPLDWPGVGEVLGASRKFVHSFRPDGATGQTFCGERVDFLGEGQPTTGMVYTPDGLPVCCLQTLPPPPPPPIPPSSLCCADNPLPMTVPFVMPATCTAFAGTYTATWDWTQAAYIADTFDTISGTLYHRHMVMFCLFGLGWFFQVEVKRVSDNVQVLFDQVPMNPFPFIGFPCRGQTFSCNLDPGAFCLPLDWSVSVAIPP